MKSELSTEELVSSLSEDQKEEHQEPKKIKKNKKYIFGGIVIIAVLHLIFMAIPLIFGESSIDILGYKYAIAVEKSQEIDNDLDGRVYRIESIDVDEIVIGDYILVYGLYNSSYYWEIEVLDIDLEQNLISATFDDIIRLRIDFDDIEGVIAGPTNFIGIVYYTSSSLRGFLSMFLIHVLIVYGLYYFMFQNKKLKLKKEVKHEKA